MNKSTTDHSSNGELANGSIVSEKSPANIRMHLLAGESDGSASPGDGTESGGTGGGIANPTVCTKKELLSKHSPLLQRAPVSKDKNPREKGSLHRIGPNANGVGQGKGSKPGIEKPIGFHLVHEKTAASVAPGLGLGITGATKTGDTKQTSTELVENDDDSDADKLSPLLRKSTDKGYESKKSPHGDSAMKKLLTGAGGTGSSGVGNETRNDMKTSPSTVITELLKGAIIGSEEVIGGNGVVSGAVAGSTVGRGGAGVGGSIITIVADDSEDYYTPEDPPATSPLKSIDDDDDELPKLSTEPDVGRKLLSGSTSIPVPSPTSVPSPAPPSALSVLKEEFSQGSLPDSPISGNSQTSTRSSSDSYSSSSSTRQLLSSGAVANDTPTHVLSSGDSATNGHSGASKSIECSIESD